MNKENCYSVLINVFMDYSRIHTLLVDRKKLYIYAGMIIVFIASPVIHDMVLQALSICGYLVYQYIMESLNVAYNFYTSL